MQPPPRQAITAPWPLAVIAGAIDGDTWAQSILQRGADDMARGLTQLGFQPGDPLCLLGGLGPHYAGYLPPAYLAGKMDAKGSALDGAFALARAEHQCGSI
ncbi:hypothetical protein [Loktanella sp. D2R18]|uniref:hypothetical protein n=2 Tax=Rhodobacterales TaxID=204455 RepID=UPI0011BED630|nr:hypothetical protein [Loktanella sp. D2R18]